MTLTTTSPTTHPTANAAPFDRARGVASIRITAMIGTGLRATPIADGRRSPIACPISGLSSWMPARCFIAPHCADGAVHGTVAWATREAGPGRLEYAHVGDTGHVDTARPRVDDAVGIGGV